VGSQVVDKTGLTGTYDFTLEYIRDRGRAISQFRGLPLADPPAIDDSGGVAGIFSALQDQLGLKLEKAKAQLDVIFVDQANKAPTDN